MKLSEMEAAVREAEGELTRVGAVAGQLASLLCGRCRSIRYSDRRALVRLKRELQRFNARNLTWEEER